MAAHTARPGELVTCLTHITTQQQQQQKLVTPQQTAGAAEGGMPTTTTRCPPPPPPEGPSQLQKHTAAVQKHYGG